MRFFAYDGGLWRVDRLIVWLVISGGSVDKLGFDGGD